MFILEKDSIITVETNGDLKTRPINYISKNHFSYLEDPKTKCEVIFLEDQLRIIKTGEINLDITHKLNEKKDIEITINQNGMSFKHEVTINTTKLNISSDVIILQFSSDENVTDVIYSLRGAK